MLGLPSLVDLKARKSCLKHNCEGCGSFKTEDPHHFVRKSHRVIDLPINLIPLCFDCHRSIHDGERKIEFAIMAGRPAADVAALKALSPTWGGWIKFKDWKNGIRT